LFEEAGEAAGVPHTFKRLQQFLQLVCEPRKSTPAADRHGSFSLCDLTTTTPAAERQRAEEE
jgi:hypothetical protein